MKDFGCVHHNSQTFSCAQVCGNIKLPLPTAQFEERETGDVSLGLGEGAVELNIAQINPVLYV
jgi:hypothetical protein